jgi:mitogen-activated protein kinase 15
MTDEIEANVHSQFEISKKLGKGAYGVVWKGADRTTKKVVAVKKCYDAFRNSTDAQRTYREVMYLQALKGHENIVQLLHIVGAENHQDLYLVFEYMETDLHVVIRANILQEIHQKFIVYQTLRALKYVHSAGLIHRDIKPSNILLNSKCDVKLCDFGLVRSASTVGDAKQLLTDYVATRWYRSPEVLLGSTQYSQAIDIWALGCILGEMISGSPIFQGRDSLKQLTKIIEVRGIPSKDDMNLLQKMSAANVIDPFLTECSDIGQQTLTDLCNGASTEALDFMSQTFQYSPHNRISAEEGLCHPYVKDFHKPNNNSVSEPTYPHDKKIQLDIGDDMKHSPDAYRKSLYADIQYRKRAFRKKESLLRRTKVGPASPSIVPGTPYDLSGAGQIT